MEYPKSRETLAIQIAKDMEAFNILEDAVNFICLNQQGQIVVESIFQKHFSGNMKLLLSCIEDNILLNDYNEEYIDWSMVIDDYEESFK